jgi:hypothetical protein
MTTISKTMPDNHDNPDLPLKLSSLSHGLRPLRLARVWAQSAGPLLLREAEFHGLVNRSGKRTLLLVVKDPLWRGELSYQRDLILDTFNVAMSRAGFKPYELAEDCRILAHNN